MAAIPTSFRIGKCQVCAEDNLTNIVLFRTNMGLKKIILLSLSPKRISSIKNWHRELLSNLKLFWTRWTEWNQCNAICGSKFVRIGSSFILSHFSYKLYWATKKNGFKFIHVLNSFTKICNVISLEFPAYLES